MNVSFYIESNGEYENVLAVFPEEIANSCGNVMSYSTVGQHSACSKEYVRELKKATAEQYAPLLQELKGEGYNDLTVLP